MANLGDKDSNDAERVDADEVLEEEQLMLADEEERLPWLESDDEEDEPAVNTSFIAFVALMGLLVVLLVLGAFWWFSRDDSGNGQIADGSTIEAPDEPYKTRPDDPGGTEVAGTGDLSFAQGEGETRESQIASDPTPAPGFGDSGDGDNGDAAGATQGVGVQIGAFSSRAKAQTGWNTLNQRFSELNGLNRRIVEADVNGATIYRLQAVAANAEGALALCDAIKAGGGDCQVKN